MTGDAVLLDLRPARIPTRMLATMLDLLIVGGATYLYGYIVSTVAGTIVIRSRALRAPQARSPVPTELAGWTSQLELSRLSDELVTASRHLLQRYDGLLSYPREQLAQDLARQMAAQTAPPPPTRLAPCDFLAAVVAERRQRESRPIHPGERVPTAEELPAGWR